MIWPRRESWLLKAILVVGVIGKDSGRDISMQWDSLKGYGKYDS